MRFVPRSSGQITSGLKQPPAARCATLKAGTDAFCPSFLGSNHIRFKAASGGKVSHLESRYGCVSPLVPRVKSHRFKAASGGKVCHLESRLRMRFVPRSSGQITSAFKAASGGKV